MHTVRFAEIFKKYSYKEEEMKVVKGLLLGFIGLGICVAMVFGLIALGKAIFSQEVECPKCECPASVTNDETPSSSGISCVKRMEPGDEAKVFTETWDAERRVWIHLYGGTCSGPYCFSYDACQDPLATLEIQPFMTGHELSPVDGKEFDICYDFKDSCSR